jgi:hypothetical protein
MVSSMLVSQFSSHTLNYVGVIGWIFGFMQLMVMPALQFLCRFLMVCWNTQMTTRKLLFFTLCWYAVPISYSTLCYFACSDAYQQDALAIFGEDIMLKKHAGNHSEIRFVLACNTVSLYLTNSKKLNRAPQSPLSSLLMHLPKFMLLMA